MKFKDILAIVSLSFLLACRGNEESQPFIPNEYGFPSDLTGRGKTMIYVDRLHGDTSFYDFFYSNIGGNNYLISKAYSTSETSDSVVYLNNKMIENYTRMPNSSKLVKGKIIADMITGDYDKKGKTITEVIFDFDSTTFLVRSESQFIEDTTTYYNHQAIPTIKLTTFLKGTIQSKIIPTIDTTFTTEFFSYYAKGIGQVKIRFPKTADNRTNTVELIQIKDRQ